MKLRLWGNSLSGTIPSQIALLSKLRESTVACFVIVTIDISSFIIILKRSCHSMPTA